MAPTSFVRRLPTLAAMTVLAATALAATSLSAQEPARLEIPQIMISAQGEVQVTPDRARISLGVDTEGKTAQEASQANAALQTKVLAALRAAGIPSASIRTSGYNVAPIQEYIPETRKWRIDGYRVNNMVVVTVEPVAKAGEIIDIALSAGANRVAGLSFEIKDATAAREQAMTQAVERAKREADIVARAAGGSILRMLEISVNSYEAPQPRPMYEMAAMRSDVSSTPVSEGTQPVTVSVTTRWQFQPRQ